MEGTLTLPPLHQQRRRAVAKGPRWGFLLRIQPDSGEPPKTIVHALLEAQGIDSYHGMAKALGYSSTGQLHTACRGGRASTALQGAILNYFPDMSFEQLFIQGKEVLRDPPLTPGQLRQGEEVLRDAADLAA